jgi:hypothetical protein
VHNASAKIYGRKKSGEKLSYFLLDDLLYGNPGLAFQAYRVRTFFSVIKISEGG